jgi:hypothetical protein
MHLRGTWRGLTLTAATTAVAVLGSGLFGIASAQATGTFSCTSTALRIGSTSISQANPKDSPCANDAKIPVNEFVPLGSLGYVWVEGLAAVTQANHPTQPGIGHGGNAQAGVLGVQVRILNQTITAGALRTLLFTWCTTPDEGAATPPPAMTVQPESDILGVQVNGRWLLNVNQPVTVPAGPYTIYLNRRIVTSNSLTARALEIDGPGLPAGGIVIGESQVDHTGNPCTAS